MKLRLTSNTVYGSPDFGKFIVESIDNAYSGGEVVSFKLTSPTGIEVIPETTFTLPSVISTTSTIRATALIPFSGDEFVQGNWVFEYSIGSEDFVDIVPFESYAKAIQGGATNGATLSGSFDCDAGTVLFRDNSVMDIGWTVNSRGISVQPPVTPSASSPAPVTTSSSTITLPITYTFSEFVGTLTIVRTRTVAIPRAEFAYVHTETLKGLAYVTPTCVSTACDMACKLSSLYEKRSANDCNAKLYEEVTQKLTKATMLLSLYRELVACNISNATDVKAEFDAIFAGCDCGCGSNTTPMPYEAP